MPGARTRTLAIYGAFLAVHVAVALRFLLDTSPGTTAAAETLPLDDGFIHLVYARSLAAFEGFAYVPGQQETGFTSPLWTILLAPLFWIRLPWDVSLVLVVKCVGVLVAWVASIFGYRLGERLAGKGAGVALALMIALDPWLAFGAVSGMEVPLACATVLAGFDYLLAGRWRAAGIGFALAIWSRPELAAVALTAIAAIALAQRHTKDPRPLRDLATPPAIAAVLWAAWNVVVSGRLLPGAFYLKHQPEGPLDPFTDLPAVFATQLLDYPWFFLGSGLLPLALGAHRIQRDGLKKLSSARLALLAAGPVWMLAVVWAHRINEPLAFYWHRYLDAGLPLLLAPTAVGYAMCIEAAVRVARHGRDSPRRDLALAALAVPLVALALVTLPGKLARNAGLQAWSSQNIVDLHVTAAQWVAQNSEPTDWVATHDAGAIRFVSDRPVVDMLGINTHRVLSAGLPRVLEQAPPRYLVLIPAWYPELVADSRVREVHRVRADHFVICERCDQDEMVILTPRRP